MLSVALTGNIAAGKSTVAGYFRRWGAVVLDADQLVREVQAPGSAVNQVIVRRFGPEVLLPDGQLDRARLRGIVMADSEARLALEAIVHPAVEARRQVSLAEARRQGARIVVSDIPLLFEAHDPAGFDAVVLVDAPESIRLQRLVWDRGLGESEARRLMAAQLPSAAKRAWRAPDGTGPIIIENDRGLAQLEQRARTVWDQLVARAGT
jgi:dephospho-CoA kinase